MYRNCIFCSADLGANESIEQFPVGRSIAFDREKGRLWAICRTCARWNLAPIEERWEAIEAGERLFRDTRLRAQSENVGLAKLRDGTRLIRVGRALPGELAVWRYGNSLLRRHRRTLLATAGSGMAGMALYGYGVAAATGVGTICVTGVLVASLIGRIRNHRPVYRVPARGAGARTLPIVVRERHLRTARLAAGEGGVELHIPGLRCEPGGRRFSRMHTEPLVLRGYEARIALGRAMRVVNASGGSRGDLDAALAAIQSAGSPAELLLSTARQRLRLDGAREESTGWGDVMRPMGTREYWTTPVGDATRYFSSGWNALMPLAVEMALHEETERRALDGELAMLEEMWREAEEIAAIADRLPDGLATAEPPRLR